MLKLLFYFVPNLCVRCGGTTVKRKIISSQVHSAPLLNCSASVHKTLSSTCRLELTEGIILPHTLSEARVRHGFKAKGPDLSCATWQHTDNRDRGDDRGQNPPSAFLAFPTFSTQDPHLPKSNSGVQICDFLDKSIYLLYSLFVLCHCVADKRIPVLSWYI